MGISTIALVGASTTGVLMRLPERFFVSGLPVVFWLSKRPNLCARWACYPPIPSINIHSHPYQAYPPHHLTPLVPPMSLLAHQRLSWRVAPPTTTQPPSMMGQKSSDSVPISPLFSLKIMTTTINTPIPISIGVVPMGSTAVLSCGVVLISCDAIFVTRR